MPDAIIFLPNSSFTKVWRLKNIGTTAATCAFGGAVAATTLSLAGRLLVGGIIHAVAQAFQGSQVSLAPLGAWIGEPAFGPLTQTIVASAEGALFGFGLAWGLTRRPRGRPGES